VRKGESHLFRQGRLVVIIIKKTSETKTSGRMRQLRQPRHTIAALVMQNKLTANAN